MIGNEEVILNNPSKTIQVATEKQLYLDSCAYMYLMLGD